MSDEIEKKTGDEIEEPKAAEGDNAGDGAEKAEGDETKKSETE